MARRGFPGIPLRNVICTKCGLIRIDPRPNDEWYQKFYEQDFFAYLRPYERPAYVEELESTTDFSVTTPIERQVIPFIIDYVRQGSRVLDIGAGFGATLYLLRRLRGIELVGIEPSPECRKLARDKIGIELLDDNIEHFLQVLICRRPVTCR